MAAPSIQLCSSHALARSRRAECRRFGVSAVAAVGSWIAAGTLVAQSTTPAGAPANAPPKPAPVAAPRAPGSALTWAVISELPALPGRTAPTGLSGVFAGALDDAHAIVAGGTFYADKGPLDGGRKEWSDAILVLEQKPAARGGDAQYEWIAGDLKLPRPLANGVSIPLDEGLLCCGGADAMACYADVFLLTWVAAERKLERVDFPPMPKPLAFAGGARSGSWVYIAGGTTSPGGRSGADFFGLDLSKRGDPAAFQWQSLPVLPRTALFPVCAGQRDGGNDVFFVFGGRDASPDQAERPFTDGQKFVPATQSWMPAGPIRIDPARGAIAITGGTAVPLEENRVLVLGGDDGEIARILDSNARRSGAEEEVEAYRKFNQALLAAHPGYRREMLIYDAAASTWASAGYFPEGTPAVTPAFLWDGAIVLVAGESRPGERSRKVWLGKFEAQ